MYELQLKDVMMPFKGVQAMLRSKHCFNPGSILPL